MYEIVLVQSIKKDLKKLDHPIREKIKNEILDILKNNRDLLVHNCHFQVPPRHRSEVKLVGRHIPFRNLPNDTQYVIR